MRRNNDGSSSHTLEVGAEERVKMEAVGDVWLLRALL